METRGAGEAGQERLGAGGEALAADSGTMDAAGVRVRLPGAEGVRAAERELLITLTYAVLNLGFHVERRSRDPLARGEIQRYLREITRALNRVEEQAWEKQP